MATTVEELCPDSTFLSASLRTSRRRPGAFDGDGCSRGLLRQRQSRSVHRVRRCWRSGQCGRGSNGSGTPDVRIPCRRTAVLAKQRPSRQFTSTGVVYRFGAGELLWADHPPDATTTASIFKFRRKNTKEKMRWKSPTRWAQPSWCASTSHEADPDLVRSMVQAFAEALMSAEAVGVVQRRLRRGQPRAGELAQRLPGAGRGTRGSARSSSPCRSCGRAATSPIGFCSPAGGPSRRSCRSLPTPTSPACRPGGSRSRAASASTG